MKPDAPRPSRAQRIHNAFEFAGPGPGAQESTVLVKRRFDVIGLASRSDARRLEHRLLRVDGVVSARVRFEDSALAVVIREEQDVGALTLDAQVALAASNEGFDVRAREIVHVQPLELRDADHNRAVVTAGRCTALTALVVLLTLLGRWSVIPEGTWRNLATGLALVFVTGVLWFGRSLLSAAAHGTPLAPRLVGVAFTTATVLALAAAVFDFFIQAAPRFDVVVLIVWGYHAIVLVLSLVLRTAEAPFRRLGNLRPKEATVQREGHTYNMRTHEVGGEDRVLVQRDERVPVDGVILEILENTRAFVDASDLLGLGAKHEAHVGDRVFAGSLNRSATIVVEPSGEVPLIDRLIRAIDVKRTGETAPPVLSGPAGAGSDWGDQAAGFLPHSIARARELLVMQYGQVGARHARCVLAGLVAAAAALAFGLARHELSSGYGAAAPAISMSVLAGAWMLAFGPLLATLTALGEAARRGVLFRDARALGSAESLDYAAFAVRGILTTGQLEVDAMRVHDGSTEREILRYALAVEHDPHDAVSAAVREFGVKRIGEDLLREIPEARSFRSLTGQGVIAKVLDREVLLGRAPLLRAKGVDVPEEMPDDGRWVHLVVQGRVVASLRIVDPVRPETAALGRRLARSKTKALILAPASDESASALATQLGAGPEGLLVGDPGTHEAAITKLVEAGSRVAVVGTLDYDRLSLNAGQFRVGVIARTSDVDESVDVLLLKSGVQGFAAALGAARSARFGTGLSVAIAVVGWGAMVPAALNMLYPAGAVVVTLLLLVLTCGGIRLSGRWLR